MKRICFFHIGAPKTGTSAIQQKLRILQNDKTLEKFNLGYPLDFSKFGLFNFTNTKQVYAGNARDLFFLAMQSKIDSLKEILVFLSKQYKGNLLLSSELFFSFPNQSKLVQKILTEIGFEIILISHIPNPFLFTVSAYSQLVKNHKYKKTFDLYLQNLFDTSTPYEGNIPTEFSTKKFFPVLDFLRVVESHKLDKNQKVRIKPYMAHKYENNLQVIESFLDMIEVKIDLSNNPQKTGKVNVGISAEKILFMHILNNAIQPTDQKLIDKIIRFEHQEKPTSNYKRFLNSHNINLLRFNLGKKLDFMEFPYWHKVDANDFENWKKLHLHYSPFDSHINLCAMKELFINFG